MIDTGEKKDVVIKRASDEELGNVYLSMSGGMDGSVKGIAAVRACAAGPWRYDVENAPRDGSEVWIEAKGEREVFRAVAKWSINHSFWATGLGMMLQDADLIAFAVPNPPEVKP